MQMLSSKQETNEITAYTIGKCIGVGQYGKVFEATHKQTATPVALKLINLAGRSKHDLKALRDEISCHRRLRHPNIVRCLDSFVTRANEEVAVITELCPQGDLMAALKLAGKFSEERVQDFASGLVNGLSFLHCKQKIIHRDLKLQNILISSSGVLKICDFGFSQFASLTLTSVKGTPIYMAPELIQEKPYSHLVDIWALGIILFELFTGLPPFYTTNIFKLIEMILNSQVQYPPEISEVFTSLLVSLLQKEPESRINWPNLREHPFLQSAKAQTESPSWIQPSKKFRPLTTDSGVDVSSAQSQKKSDQWDEIDGLDVINDDLNAVYGANVSEAKLQLLQPAETPESFDWQEMMGIAKSQKLLRGFFKTPGACDILFNATCMFPTALDESNFSVHRENIHNALTVNQRMVVLLSTSSTSELLLNFPTQIRNLLRWASSLVHGLLQLDAQLKYFNLDLITLLELTLQLLADSVHSVILLCLKIPTVKAATPNLTQLLIQIYLPLVPRILYSAVNKSQGDSISSSLTEYQNDKWLPVIIPALAATRKIFLLTHRVESWQIRSQCFDDVVELGVAFSVADFVHEFWNETRIRKGAVEVALLALCALASPYEVADKGCCLVDVWRPDSEKGTTFASAWARVLEATGKCMVMNSGFFLDVTVSVVLNASQFDHQTVEGAMRLLTVLTTSSASLQTQIFSFPKLLPATARIALLKTVSTESTQLAALQLLNCLEMSAADIPEFISVTLQQLQSKAQEETDEGNSLALICAQMRILSETVPDTRLPALNEYFSRLSRLENLMGALKSQAEQPLGSMFMCGNSAVEDFTAAAVNLTTKGLYLLSSSDIFLKITNATAIAMLFLQRDLTKILPHLPDASPLLHTLSHPDTMHIIRSCPPALLHKYLPSPTPSTRRNTMTHILHHAIAGSHNIRPTVYLSRSVADNLTVAAHAPLSCAFIVSALDSRECADAVARSLVAQTIGLGAEGVWGSLLRDVDTRLQGNALVLLELVVESVRGGRLEAVVWEGARRVLVGIERYGSKRWEVKGKLLLARISSE